MLLSKNTHYLKGIHPGIYIDRLLKKSKISQRKLAETIHVHHQTLNAIIKTKRNLNLKMALKIERYFNIEEGTLMLLQLFYEIEVENAKTQKTPNLDLLVFPTNKGFSNKTTIPSQPCKH